MVIITINYFKVNVKNLFTQPFFSNLETENSHTDPNLESTDHPNVEWYIENFNSTQICHHIYKLM